MLETITPTHLIWLFFLVWPPEEAERNLFVSPSVSVQTNRMSKHGKSEVDARLANQRVAWHVLQSNVFSTVKDYTIGIGAAFHIGTLIIDRKSKELMVFEGPSEGVNVFCWGSNMCAEFNLGDITQEIHTMDFRS